MAVTPAAPPLVLVHARAPDDRERFASLVGGLGAEVADLKAVPDSRLHAESAEPVLAQTGGPGCPLDRLLSGGRAGVAPSSSRPLILLMTRDHLPAVAVRTAHRTHAILLTEPYEEEELASILRASLAIEARRREAHAVLDRLKEANEELERRRAEAEQEARRRTQFLAAISHDLRTPLWEIALFGQVVQAAAECPAAPVDWNRLATGLLAGVATLRERVDDMFDLARLDLGAIDVREEAFLLGPFLDRALASFRDQARERGLGFVVDSSPPWAEVVTDPDKVSRVLQNLASNALKFTDTGGVHVSATFDPAAGLAISVRDTGRGISREMLLSIFDEFAQVNNPERDRAKGTGLGLAICLRLANVLGGDIDVRSEPGEGSEFTLRLPTVRGPRADGR